MSRMVAPRALLLAGLALLAAGCASGPRYRTLPPPAGDGRVGARPARGADPALASERPEVQRAVEVAESLVGRREVVVDGHDYGPGCAALVRAALEQAGHSLPPSARDASSLHAIAEARGSLRRGLQSAPGDVVFLADRPGGRPAHVGLVARVDPDGTAVVLHRLARGVARMRLNLSYPARAADPATGKRLNDTLAVGSTALPAGSLVVGVAPLL
jgi:hypothetical protein